MSRRVARRTVLAVHRWLGGLSALFLLSLSLTGLALNHTEWLGLDQTAIRAPFILKRYGMSTGSDIVSTPLKSGQYISRLGGRIYLDSEAIATAGELIGVREEAEFSVVVTDGGLLLLTPDGELVEQLEVTSLPMEAIAGLAAAPGGDAILIDDEQAWRVTEGWLDFEPYAGEYTVRPMPTAELPEPLRQELLNTFQGDGVPLYRVMLDLHSGRLFGWAGRTLMDLSAVAVIVLISTGFFAWVRTKRNRAKPEAVA